MELIPLHPDPVPAATMLEPSFAAGAARDDLCLGCFGPLGSSSSEAKTLLEHTLLQRNHMDKAKGESCEVTFILQQPHEFNV